ncbi:MAG: CoA transferase [Proteobacteria bacterium]|nr:CoA transferase [Pseudomonadota bacterium]
MGENNALPLAGIRVLDAATYIAAPVAAAILSEFGAEVIKIEKPGIGDPLRRFGAPSGRPDASLFWMNESRNKRGITLDLGKPEGAELFKRMAAKADVVCENFRPGTFERWGLGYDALSAINPGLVLLRISAYGQTGPWSEKIGFARMAHALSGVGYLAGEPDGAPVNPGPSSLADYVCAVYGALGVTLALRERDNSGKGQVIDLSLVEAMFRSLDQTLPNYKMHGHVRERTGSQTPAAAPNRNFPTGGGGWVSLSCTNDKMFQRLCQAMGRPELAQDPRYAMSDDRIAHRDEVEGITQDWTTSMPREAVVEACDKYEVPCAPILSIADICAHPQFLARDMFVALQDELAGEVVLPGVVPKLSRTPGQVKSLGPDMGQDNDTIYRELLDLSENEIAGLRDRAVI